VASVVKILTGVLVALAIHGYLWWRLVHATRLPRRFRRIATAVLAVLFVAIIATTGLRIEWPGFASTVGWITMPWLAFAGLTMVTLLAFDLIRALGWGVQRVRRVERVDGTGLPRPGSAAEGQRGWIDPSRRQFLARATGGAAVAVASVSVAGGMLSARGEHVIEDVEIFLPKLPRELDGFTIVQLSDLHVGMTIGREFVERVVARANALKPDLIALTGDLIDGKVADLRDDVAPLGDLRAPHGVFAVTGNHEYYAGAQPWIEEITRLGARYLNNERVTITRDGASFDLAGIYDRSGGDYGQPPDLRAALAGREPSRVVVLMAHQPRQVHGAAFLGVDLQLSGHTHGGQIWPWHYLVRLQQEGFLAGRYQLRDTQLYVTRGCGYWGPPVRVLAPLEITRVILRSGTA
jgi:hypothetical protein